MQKKTAHRAANLGGHTQPVARQQHAFHHLAVGQRKEQARAVVASMFGVDAGKAVQFHRQRG